MNISFELCRPIEEHARQVMDWQNDADAQVAPFHTAPKQWEQFWPEYCGDYFRDAECPSPVFGLVDGARAGFLRFVPTPHPLWLAGRTADISINLAPNFRGKGIGITLLGAALDHLGKQGIDSVYTEVRNGNEASLKTFDAAGFTALDEIDRRIDDLEETFRVRRFIKDITSAFWRRDGVYVIAEAGSNWRMGSGARDLEMAHALIDVAVNSGANAVKFQTFRPEQTYAVNAGSSDYLSESGINMDISEIFSDLAMPYEMIGKLAAYCQTKGIDFLSSAFSPEDFAAIDPHVSVHKIASYEISHIRLLELAGRSGKPTVLSTGASNDDDISWAVDTYLKAGGRDLCLMQCTAKYPAPLNSLNLGSLAWLSRRFQMTTGLSDHSREPLTGPTAAVALGARVIEKHFTLDNRLPGPDHTFALLPEELKAMVDGIRATEKTLGGAAKLVLEEEQELASFARRGLQAVSDINSGDVLSEGINFAILRPGENPLGAHPRWMSRIEGCRARSAIRAGHGLSLDDCE